MLWSRQYPKGRFEVYADRPELDLIHVHQQHTAKVIVFDGNNTEEMIADGIISPLSVLQGKALAIKTADCLPIMLLSDTHVAMIHAGWKGLATNILTAPELLKNEWKHILIGPSIRDYEVQEDFKTNFPHSDFFRTQSEKTYFDLQKEAVSQLQEYSAKIEDSGICTLNNNDYNSYRRDKTTQRNWNIFRI